MLHGVDLSHYQGTINWPNIKASCDFAIIKATEGDPDQGQTVAEYEDSQFLANQNGARIVGILHGFYHFARPDVNEPIGEAIEFATALGALQAGEILFLDFETAGNTGMSDAVAWAKAWLDKVTELTGVKPLIYLSASWIAAHDWSSVYNAGYGLWVADYGVNNGTIPTIAVNTAPWPTAAFWQYTSVGNVAGIHPIDMNNFYGDSDQFEAYGYQVPTVVAPTPPVVPSVNPLQSQLDDANAQISELTQQLEAADAELDSRATQLTTMKTQLDTITTSVNNLTTLNAQLLSQNNSLKTEVNKVPVSNPIVIPTGTIISSTATLPTKFVVLEDVIKSIWANLTTKK